MTVFTVITVNSSINIPYASYSSITCIETIEYLSLGTAPEAPIRCTVEAPTGLTTIPIRSSQLVTPMHIKWLPEMSSSDETPTHLSSLPSHTILASRSLLCPYKIDIPLTACCSSRELAPCCPASTCTLNLSPGMFRQMTYAACSFFNTPFLVRSITEYRAFKVSRNLSSSLEPEIFSLSVIKSCTLPTCSTTIWVLKPTLSSGKV